MAATPPDHRAVFRLSLGEILLGNMVDLHPRHQRRQWCQPFECHGMHWILTLEKWNPENGGAGHDIFACLYSLSVPRKAGTGDTFPLKGEILVDQGIAQDGQARSYHARQGRACNLVGKNFPANALRIDGVIMLLRSGATQSEEVEVSNFSEGFLRGYYGEDWNGMGATLLKNHVVDPLHDGQNIEVQLWFPDRPRALTYVP